MKNEMTKNLQSKLFKLDTDALYEVVKQFKKEDKGYIQVGESFNDMVRIQGIPPYIIFNCLLEVRNRKTANRKRKNLLKELILG